MYEQFQNIMKMGPFGQIMVSSFRIFVLWPYSLNSSLKQDSKGDSAQAVLVINPALTPMSDQNRISPYNINTKSRRQVMRTKKSIN